MNILLSYHYFQDPALFAQLHAAGVRVLLDSGAYSAFTLGKPINLEEYARFAREVRPYIVRCFTLDVIGDPALSVQQQAYLKRSGINPIPVWHDQRGDMSGLDAFLEGEDYVSLGGLASAFAGKANYHLGKHKLMARITGFIKAVNKRAGIHLLGYGNINNIQKLGAHITSVDTSTDSMQRKFGIAMHVLDPVTLQGVMLPSGRSGLKELSRINFLRTFRRLAKDDSLEIPDLYNLEKQAINHYGGCLIAYGGWLLRSRLLKCQYYTAITGRSDVEMILKIHQLHTRST